MHAISVFLLFSRSPDGRSIQLNFSAILPVRVDWEIFTCLLSLVRSLLHKCIYILIYICICVYISIIYIQ